MAKDETLGINTDPNMRASDRQPLPSLGVLPAQQKVPTAPSTAGDPPVSPGNHQQNIPAELRNPHGNVSSWYLGQTSAQYESGSGGPGTISSGSGDYGGKSYGIYQFSLNMESLQEYVAGSKQYGPEFRGLTPGSGAFDQKWKDIAARDPQGFSTDQHDFIKSQYFDVQNERLKEKGIDLSDRGRAVQDALWSTSVQYRNMTPGIFQRSLNEAYGHTDISKLTDQQIIGAVQDNKLRNTESYFSGSPELWSSLRDRARNEKSDLTALANDEQAVKRGGINVPIDLNRGPEPDVINGNRRTLADGVLTMGEKSDAVKQLQDALNRVGARDDRGGTLTADGDFGDRTRQGLVNYQKANGLEATGIADAQVFAKLGLSFDRPQQSAPMSQDRSNNMDAIGTNAKPLSQDTSGKAEHDLVSRQGHPGNLWYQQALAAVDKLPPNQVKPDQREETAASIALQVMAAPHDRRLGSIQGIQIDANGSPWVSDKTNVSDPVARVQMVNMQANDELSMRQLSQKIAELPEANRALPKELAAVPVLQGQQVSAQPVPAVDEEKRATAFLR